MKITALLTLVTLSLLSSCNSVERILGTESPLQDQVSQEHEQSLDAETKASPNAVTSSCITPIGLTIKDTHVIYWLGVCVQRYKAYIYFWQVAADPYAGYTAVLIQKRDIMLYCNSNPWICQYAIRVCPY